MFSCYEIYLSDMKKGTAVIFNADKQSFEFSSFPKPQPRGQELLVRNSYVTLCSSDLKTYSGERKEANPTILGHETCGHLEALGPDAAGVDEKGQPLHIGDRLTWAVFASPKEDPQSQAGRPQKAEGLFKYGHEKHTADCSWHGGLADYTLLRPNSIVIKVKDSMPKPVLAMANCAVATMAGAIRLAGPMNGMSVLIAGAGTLGLVGCAMSKVAGASKIAVVEPVEHRRAKAAAFGATHTYTTESVAGYFDIVLETSGIPASMERTLELLAIGGRAIWVGAVFPQRKVELGAEQLIRGLHTIKGLHNYNRLDFIRAVDFLENYHSRFPFNLIVEKEFPLSEAKEAFKYAIFEKPLRVGIFL